VSSNPRRILPERIKGHVFTSCFLLILALGAACIRREPLSQQTPYSSKVLMLPVLATELQLISGTGLQEEQLPWFVFEIGDQSVQVWYYPLGSEEATRWPSVKFDRFQNKNFIILAGKFRIHVKNLIWAIVVDRAA
jgi:hypothetical protein